MGYLASNCEIFADSIYIYTPSQIYNLKSFEEQQLYLILEVPKFYIADFTFVIEENKIIVKIKYQNSDILTADLYFDIDIETISIDKNKKTLWVNNEPLSLFQIFNNVNISIETTLLYVGQGVKDCAIDRLKKHSTFQKILANNHDNSNDKDILVVTFSMLEKRFFDTITPIENSNNTINDINDFASKLDLINVTEAILINYFKPKYNIDFKNSIVPSEKHYSYSQYFSKQYNSLVVSLLELKPFIIKTDNKIFNPIENFIPAKLNWDKNILEFVQSLFTD